MGDQADETRAARRALRGEPADGPESAAHAIEVAEGLLASFWGSRWFRVVVVVVAAVAVLRLALTLAGGGDGPELVPRFVAAVVLPISAYFLARQRGNLERSIALNRAMLDGREGSGPPR